MVDIANVDNYDEYTHLYALEGIEGFALRHYLRETACEDIPLCDYNANTAVAALQRIKTATNDRLPIPDMRYRQALSQSKRLSTTARTPAQEVNT
jgi:hypothetical protein